MKNEANVCLGFVCPGFTQKMISVFTFSFSSPHTKKHFPKFSTFLHYFWCISPNFHVNVNFQFKHAATHLNK